MDQQALFSTPGTLSFIWHYVDQAGTKRKVLDTKPPIAADATHCTLCSQGWCNVPCCAAAGFFGLAQQPPWANNNNGSGGSKTAFTGGGNFVFGAPHPPAAAAGGHGHHAEAEMES